jgi:DNA-binding transcriptional ArsR family regulator
MKDALSPIFAALADPTRRAILSSLTHGDATVAQLARPFEMSQPAISKHLRVLEAAGLISRTRVATARYSHLEPAALQKASEWVDAYRQYWTESFDKLDTALARYQEETPS